MIQIGVLLLSYRIQRDVGHLALLSVGQEGVAQGMQFGTFGKEAGEGVGADIANAFDRFGLNPPGYGGFAICY